MSDNSLMNRGQREIFVEKYRPNTIDDVVGHPNITESLKRYIENQEVPNLLFEGPSGVGKTASAIALARELYGDNWREFYLELNASDERGIDVVRDKIKDYSSTSLAGNFQRMVFLDEADSLTDDAQSALRRTMERYADKIIYIYSCNYPDKIIPAIQSRCTRFHFGPIDDEIIKGRVNEIAENEDIEITQDGLNAIAFSSNGDLRMAIQTLQSVSVFEETITEDRVYTIMSHPDPDEVEEMILLAGSGQFNDSIDKLEKLMYTQGMSSGTILDVMHDIIWELQINEKLMVRLANQIGETDYRISQGGNEHIQMPALLSEFSLMAEGKK